MAKVRNQTIVTVLFEEFLLRRVDEHREKMMERTGFISRSAVVRQLVVAGLERWEKEGTPYPQKKVDPTKEAPKDYDPAI